MDHSDNIARKFSPNLKAKDGLSQLIEKAALVGGYLHLLCSVVHTTDEGQTVWDGMHGANDYNGYNLEAHYKLLLICRLCELMNEIMDARRSFAIAAADVL